MIVTHFERTYGRTTPNLEKHQCDHKQPKLYVSLCFVEYMLGVGSNSNSFPQRNLVVDASWDWCLLVLEQPTSTVSLSKLTISKWFR